jgi:hypothetical protein
MQTGLIGLKGDHEALDRSFFRALSPSEKMAMVWPMFTEQWLLKGGDAKQLRLRRVLAFNAASVKYLVIGAYALAAYARPGATGDIDLWVESNADNARHVYDASVSFGAPLDDVSETTFAEPDIAFQMGVAPIRIDILTGIDGITFGGVAESHAVDHRKRPRSDHRKIRLLLTSAVRRRRVRNDRLGSACGDRCRHCSTGSGTHPDRARGRPRCAESDSRHAASKWRN